MRSYFRDEFFSLDARRWAVVQTGPGMVVTVNGLTGGSRYLNINMGTTNGSETIIESVPLFTFPLKLAVALSMSQRIAGNECFVELVGVNDRTKQVEVDTTYPPTALGNNAANATALKFDGTTPTNAIYIVRGEGISELASAASGFVGTTSASGSNPNWLPAAIYEIFADVGEVLFSSRPIDSLAAMNAPWRRQQNLPDESKSYKIRLRCRNVSVPASATDFRLHFVRTITFDRSDTSRFAGRSTDAAMALPVSPVSTPSGNSLIGDIGIQYRGNTTGASLIYKMITAATTNAGFAKAAAGRVLGWHFTNTTAAAKFVKLYNKSSAPTVGTDIPVITITVPPNGLASYSMDGGIGFTTGIAIACTGAAPDADTTATAVGDVVGGLFYV